MRRAVVTGLGLVTSIGIGKEAFWQNLLAGTQGFKPVNSFDTSGYKVHVGGEIHNFHFEEHSNLEKPRGRATQFALVAGEAALADAGLRAEDIGAVAGVAMGTTSGEPQEVEKLNDHRKTGRAEELGPWFAHTYPCHNIPAGVAATLGLYGTAPMMLPAACAAGNYAVAHAFDQIRLGRAKVMLAGGSDSFSRITYTGFARMFAISPDLCRPFDLNRKGMIPGEGAAFLVVEEYEHARARGAEIYAEVAGYGLTCDAFHMTGSHPESRGAVDAMGKALADSQLTVADIDYISAHGTGTKSNDHHEAQAVIKVFGDYADKIPVSSIKSMLGHTMGAASAVEAAACCLAIRDHRVPPTMNYETPDPDCRLDVVANESRKHRVRVAMNNAYAFGGTNASVIFKEV